MQGTVGFLAMVYLALVRLTNRFTTEPEDPYRTIGPLMPVIVAMWHGQHFMIHFAKRRQDRAVSLVSRSRDGDLNASILKWLGIRAIRGSGARGRNIRKKGGITAMRAMIRALKHGETGVMTADVPKIARVCGKGIVTLAQISGRPIVAAAVVTSRRKVFKSWDRASIGLPFGRGAIVIGTPVFVAAEAGPEELEDARRRVEAELNAVHQRAYALVGGTDPGASLAPAHKQEAAV
ncbi:MAG: lysophospholipid acyltransferase family protein [Methylobacteriaceae bacterium]|nr:lysophospholipid acyltransferase family protein [Methylobacteriaceae bacterium]